MSWLSWMLLEDATKTCKDDLMMISTSLNQRRRCWIWYSTNITKIPFMYIFMFHEYSIHVPLTSRCQSASWEPHHSKALTRAASSIDATHGTSKASRRRAKGTRQPLALTKLNYVSYNYSMMYHDYHDVTWSYIYIHFEYIIMNIF